MRTWSWHCLNKNCLKNLSTTPPHTTRTWEVTLPIPHWILLFFLIEVGLLLHIKVSISENGTKEEYNSFSIEIYFRWHHFVTSPQEFEGLRIVHGSLWPNPNYLEEENHTPSRVSLATEVTASENTQFNTPSPTSSSLEQSVPPNSQHHWLPFQENLTVDKVFERICSGRDLNQPAFTEGNITFQNLRDIDWSTNPHLYRESSGTANDNKISQHNKEIEEEGCQLEHPQEEEEEDLLQVEEGLLSPLPIPGPSTLLICSPISPTLESERNLNTWFYESTSDRLGRHLGEHLETILEETFQEKSTLESE